MDEIDEKHGRQMNDGAETVPKKVLTRRNFLGAAAVEQRLSARQASSG